MPLRSRLGCPFSVALAAILTGVSAAQSTSHFDLAIPLGRNSSWQVAETSGASMYKLAVVTLDHPDRMQSCRVKSFTSDRLVCARLIGRPHSYRADQVLAIIVPGDGGLRLPIWLSLNAVSGAAIWGTVVLTATCPPCAAATAFAALVFLGAAGAIALADDVTNKLLYLAPGQELSEKLGYVKD